MHHIPLEDSDFRQVLSATSLRLAVFELLHMPCSQVFLAGFGVGFGIGGLLVFVLLLGEHLLSVLACNICVIAELGLLVVLSAGRALAVHLLHNVVDAEQAHLIVARTCEEGVVGLIQCIHAQWAALFLIFLHDDRGK